MNKHFVRILSAVLSVVLLIGIFSINVFAENDAVVNDYDTDYNISNSTSFGKIVNNTIASNDNFDSGYSITALDIYGKQATVEFNNSENCFLVVAIYDENSLQLVGSGIVKIEEPSVGSAIVNIEIDIMPTYFIAHAYLLDSDYAPLCDKYISKHYTKAFEEFYEKTPEDFSTEKTIIINDHNDKIDFAVINSNVESIETSSKMTMRYDEQNASYIFENATDEIKALSVGDIFFYQYGENSSEFIILKVKTITTSNSIVVITEDNTIGISDVFDFINIEGEGDYSNAYVDEENLDECYTLIRDDIALQDINYDEKESFSVSVGLEHTSKSSSGVLSGKISGTLGLTLSVHAKIYYDAVLFGKDYYEIKVTTNTDIGFTVTVEGKISAFSGKRIPIPYISVGGVFDFEINISPDISFSANGTFKGSIIITTIVSYDSVNELNKTQTTNAKIDPDISGTIEFKFGAKIEFKLALYCPPHAKKLKIKTYTEVVSISIAGAGGLKFTGKTENIEPKHPCKPCISGNIRIYAEITGTLKVCIIPKIIDFTLNVKAWSKEWYLTDFYFSLSASPIFKMEKGVVCPNKYHDVNVTVKDSDGNPIEGVLITAANCICDADGDKKYNDTQIKTNSDGKAIICLKKGTHTVQATFDDTTKEQSIQVLEITKTINFVFDKSSTNPDDPGVVPPPYGDGKISWSISGDTLTISGTGKMDNYNGFGSAPWFSYASNIKKVVISDGITYIGNYAFAQLEALNTVVIPDSVEQIGTAAFYGCSNIREIALGEETTEIGDYAFYYCYRANKLSINSKLSSIGQYAFAQCTTIPTVDLPATISNIGNGAFAFCHSLSSITIRNSKCAIYNSEQTINNSAKIYGASGSTAQTYANNFGRSFGVISVKSNSNDLVLNGTNDAIVVNAAASSADTYKINQASCVPGGSYILINVTGWGNNFVLTSDNLFYIDQVVADANGVVNVNFVPKSYNSNSTTLLIGDFGNGTVQKKVNPKKVVDMSGCEITIQNPSTTNINYGDTLILHANLSLDELEEGAVIIWSVEGNGVSLNPSDDGLTCNVTSVQNGSVTVTATLVDSDGNPVLDAEGNEISVSQNLNSKVNFWQKIVSFFKNLFRISRIISQ